MSRAHYSSVSANTTEVTPPPPITKTEHLVGEQDKPKAPKKVYTVAKTY